MGIRLNRLAVTLAAPMLIAAGPSQPPLTSADLAKLVDAKPGGPGCAVAIVQDGKLAMAEAFGLADVETKRPLTPDTPFNVASMTKQFTGMAVALLIQDGKLSEQDDIRKYLPELKDYGQVIRVEHLLNHSSGLRNHMALAAFGPGDHLPSHEQALRLVYRQSALNFAPGSRHQYDSPNYVLLAEIVSRASGQRYEDFLAQRVLKPLGMANSGFAVSGLARAYAPIKEGGWKLQEKVNGARGSSGLLSTVRDFAQWMINYDKMTVGGRPAIEKMLSTSKLNDGTPITYRYGLIKQPDYAGVKGLTRIAHGGQTAAFRSAFSFFPGRGFGDVVMCNHMANANGIDSKLVSAFVEKLKPPQPAAVSGSGVAAAMPAGLPAQLAGTYYSRDDDDVRELLVKDGSLVLRIFGQEFPLTYKGSRTFAFGDQGEFRFDERGTMTEAFGEQAVLQFEKLPAIPAQNLADFAGTYRSADVDGEVTIEPKGEKLLLRFPAGEAELAAVGRDHFSGQEFDVNSAQFHRGQSGSVDGLSLTVSSGITRLRLVRAR